MTTKELARWSDRLRGLAKIVSRPMTSRSTYPTKRGAQIASTRLHSYWLDHGGQWWQRREPDGSPNPCDLDLVARIVPDADLRAGFQALVRAAAGRYQSWADKTAQLAAELRELTE